MADRPHLRSLSDRVGILPEYHDITGTLRVTKDCIREAILASMGFDASTESGASRALKRLSRTEEDRLLPPVRVVVRDHDTAPNIRLGISDAASSIEWRVELEEEDGTAHTAHGCYDPSRADQALHVKLPVNPPAGYHTVRVMIESRGNVHEAEQSLIISPGRCAELPARLEDNRAFGVWTNLYSIRSRQNWGVGDLTDAVRMMKDLAPCGAAFLGINPLHALLNRNGQISPYCPVSRLFRNPVYLDVELVPEIAQCPQARAMVSSEAFVGRLAGVRDARLVDYETIAGLKLDVLRRLHEVFLGKHADGRSERGRAYADYLHSEGEALVDFATFSALRDWLKTDVGGGRGWPDWPQKYRSPDSPDVEAYRSEHRREIDFHCYVQFELDRQLAQASDAAKHAGMAIGLYPDLAIGSAPDGSDAWAYQVLLAKDMEVGAPPDPYAETGQTWGFPPVVPLELEARRFDYWIRLLRASLAHAGMLRIDHILGLFRQYWVPDGVSAMEGAYVRYPADALLGILALESCRHDAVIVGEDLGTVPPEVPGILSRWGILSSRVLYFERERDGSFRPARSYSNRALVTATTHDHVPLPGFWIGRDLDIRAELGQAGPEEQRQQTRQERRETRSELLRAFVAEGIAMEEEHATPDAVCAGAYSFLARTPAPLVGVSLDDLAGEQDPVNLPGIPGSRYPNWSRKMRRSIEDILADPSMRRVLAEMRAARSVGGRARPAKSTS